MSDAPEIVKLKELLVGLPDALSGEDLWNLRSNVGGLMLGASSETLPILNGCYGDLTTRLKARAEKLGKGEEFARAERLTQLMLETEGLRAELEAA